MLVQQDNQYYELIKLFFINKKCDATVYNVQYDQRTFE